MTLRLAALFVLACPALASAQAPAQPMLEFISLERIRRGLATTGPLTVTSAQGDRDRPVFRLRIDESIPRAPHFTWDPSMDAAVGSYVRPRIPGTHYEYLRMTTPEAFRASTLYPAGVDLLSPSAGIVSAIRGWFRQREERAIRQRIKEELEALKKAQGIQ